MKRRYMAAVAAAAISCGLMPAAASAKLKIGVTDATMQNRDPVQFWQNVNALHLNVIRSQIGWAHDRGPQAEAPRGPERQGLQLEAARQERQGRGGLGREGRRHGHLQRLGHGEVGAHVQGQGRRTCRCRRRPTSATSCGPLAKRYNGTFIPAGSPAGTKPLPRITHWEIWNEPNNALGLAKPNSKKKAGVPAGAKAYRTLLSTAYNAIHAPGPDR